MLIRGFGLANRRSHDDSHIVIILEEVGLWHEHEVQEAPALDQPSESRRNFIEDPVS